MGASRRSTATCALLIGVFFLALYLLSGSSDLRHNGDTDLRYQTTAAIVDHFRLWIAHPLWTDTRVALGRGGHLYAFYAPGQTIFMIPLYVAGKVLAHHLSLPYDVTTLYAARSLDLFLGAGLAVLFFLMARSLGYAACTAVLLTLAFGLATVVWPDAQSALEQTQVDLFLLLAVYGAWRFASGDLRERRWLFLAGAGAGLAFFTRYDAGIYIVLVALYPLALRWWRMERSRLPGDALAYASGVVPWVVAVGAWNIARFGSPFQTGLHEKTLGEPVWTGLAALLVSPGKGLVWYLPLLFLLPAALPPFYRAHRSLTAFFAVMVGVTVLFYANVQYWHGDPAWGPRYLYVIVPYLILPLGELLESWNRRSVSLRVAAVALVAASLVIQVSAVTVTQWRFWYRLEVAEAGTQQPFQWGASHYHYYWNVRQSPILVQLDDVYQVGRLYLGDERYRLTTKPPDPLVHSNPASDYPVNSWAFWWADTMHPLLGARARAAIALGLLATGGAALLALLFQLRGLGPSEGRRRRLDLSSPEAISP